MQLKNGIGILQTTTPLPFSYNGCNLITYSATPQNNTVYTTSFIIKTSVLIWNAMFWPTRVIVRHKCVKGQWQTFKISHLLKRDLFLTIFIYDNYITILEIHLMQPYLLIMKNSCIYTCDLCNQVYFSIQCTFKIFIPLM